MSRRNNFDFIRFMLATLVLWGHAFALPFGNDNRDLLRRISLGQMFSGRVAVLGFFCISGLLITLSWQHSKNAADYLKKRVLRIYPGFVVAALFNVFVAGAFGSSNVSAYWRSLRTIVLMRRIVLLDNLQVYTSFERTPYHIINGSLWTIQSEFFCYLAVIILGIIGLYRRPRIMLFLTTALVALYWRDEVHPSHKLDTLRWFLPVYVFFGVGMALALYQKRVVYTDRGAAWCVVLLLVACRVPHGLTFTMVFSWPYLLFWLAQTSRLKMQNWTTRIGGDYSYGLYLYSFPIQQLLIRYVPTASSPLILFALSFPLSFAAAFLSWNLIEKPFLRRKEATNPTPEPLPRPA